MNQELTLRPVTEEDIPLLYQLITELAEYEKMADVVYGTAEDLRRSIFERNAARALIAYAGEEVAGMSVWCYNFSTFECKPGLYLEDLFIRPAFRRRGYGDRILRHLAALAVEEDCARMEWSVLNWNDPAIRFYNAIGATPVDGWTVYRLTGDALISVAKGK